MSRKSSKQSSHHKGGSKQVETIENGLIRGYGKYLVNGEVSQVGLVHCSNEAECNKFGKDDIVQALNQRAVVFSDAETKPMLIKKLLKSNKMWLQTLSAERLGPSGRALHGKFPSMETNPAMYFLTGRDFREDPELVAELKALNLGVGDVDLQNMLAHMTKKRVFGAIQRSVEGQASDDLIFAETVGQRLQIDKNFNEYSTTQVDASGNQWKGASVASSLGAAGLGAIAMKVMQYVNKHQGLLKTNYLTVDHVGLEMDNASGSRYRAAYDPIGDKGFWVAVRGIAWIDIPDAMKLNGTFLVDAHGLPLVSQLDWNLHKLKVMKDRQDRIMQVRCYRKDLSANKGEEDDNCRTDRNGKVLVRWAPYDPTLKVFISPLQMKRYYTPMGLLSYEEIMALPLEKITQMLVVMKLLQESKTAEGFVTDAGFSFGDDGRLKNIKPMYPVVDLYGQSGTSLSGVPIRNKTNLPAWFTTAEDAWYRNAGLKVCGGRKPFRCHIDSEAPGTCSPDPAVCYDPKVGEIYNEKAGRSLKAQEIRSKIRTKSAEPNQPYFAAISDSLSATGNPPYQRALNDREVNELLKFVQLDSRGQLVLTNGPRDAIGLQSGKIFGESGRIQEFKTKSSGAVSSASGASAAGLSVPKSV